MTNNIEIPRPAGSVDSLPRRFLRFESGAMALAAIIAFSRTGQSWWWFFGLIVVPDLSMLGYLAGPRRGAVLYNAAHIYAGPLILGALAVLAGSAFWLAAALIWIAHIALDRLLGFGLKHPDGFAATHLGPLGQPPNKIGEMS